MTRHHPDDDFLLAHAAGSLGAGSALLASVHLEQCPRCREIVRGFAHLGGALLSEEDESVLPSDAFTRVMGRLEETPAPSPVPVVGPRPGLPAGMEWPRSLRHCKVSRWWPLAPGMRWSRVRIPGEAAANVFLLRIGAGRSMPAHTHDGEELTQILYGAFDDGRAVFRAGDFDATDGSIRHQPVVQTGGECICLASVGGRLRFDGAVSRWLGSLVGL